MESFLSSLKFLKIEKSTRKERINPSMLIKQEIAIIKKINRWQKNKKTNQQVQTTHITLTDEKNL